MHNFFKGLRQSFYEFLNYFFFNLTNFLHTLLPKAKTTIINTQIIANIKTD
jgi:hypothetical protein